MLVNLGWWLELRSRNNFYRDLSPTARIYGVWKLVWLDINDDRCHIAATAAYNNPVLRVQIQFPGRKLASCVYQLTGVTQNAPSTEPYTFDPVWNGTARQQWTGIAGAITLERPVR